MGDEAPIEDRRRRNSYMCGMHLQLAVMNDVGLAAKSVIDTLLEDSDVRRVFDHSRHLASSRVGERVLSSVHVGARMPAMTYGMVGVSLIAAMAMAGCGKSSSDKAGSKETEDAGTAIPELSDRERYDQLGDKTRGYIKCINRHSEPMSAAERAYFKMFKNRDSGPKRCKVRGVPLATLDPGDCVRNVARSKKRPPALPDLEQAGEAFAAAMVALYEPTKELVSYYESKQHKDDKCGRGIEVHAKMVEGWSAYKTAHEALRRKLDEISNREERARLELLAKEAGRDSIRYLHGVIMIEADEALQLFKVQATKEKQDNEAILAKADLVGEAINKLASKVSANRRSAEAEIKGISDFVAEAVAFRKLVMKFAREKNPLTRIEAFLDREQGLVAKYNALVEASNSLMQRVPRR